MKKIVLTGGGTMGHVTPHLTLIPRLLEKGYEIHYVGSENGMELRTLDELSSGCSAPFGVLKADIEGAGLHFLKGARKTICRDRPLLSLSIYHNEEEFAGIYQTLRSWDLDYHCEIKQFSPYTQHGEYSLFAYPAEWIE